MAYVSSANNLSPLERTKWSRSVLRIFERTLVMQQFASTPDVLNTGDGLTMRFTRQLPHGQSPGSWTDITNHGSDSGEKNIPLFKQFDVSPTVYGDKQIFDLYSTRAAFLSYVNAAKETYGNWYKEELDYVLTKLVGQACYLMRADGDTAYEVNSSCTSDGTTTTLVDTARTEDDDYWNGGIVVMLTGNNQGEGRIVSDFDNGTTTITLSVALIEASDSGDKYHLCVTTGLTTNDKISQNAIKKAVRALEDNRAPKFDGGFYVGTLDPYTKFDYIDSLISVAQYTEKGIKILFKNEIGIANGVRWVFANRIYRADAALYAENTSGDVRVTFIMGKGAYGTVKCDMSNMPKLTLQSPLGGSTDPQNLKGQLGVAVAQAPTMLNAMNVVGIANVPTA